MTIDGAILGALAVVVGGVFTYLGVRLTNSASRAATVQTGEIADRRQDFEETKWLLETYKDEIKQLPALKDRVAHLEQSRHRDKRVISALVRWSRAMRDEIIRLGGTVPERPDVLDLLDADPTDDGNLP